MSKKDHPNNAPGVPMVFPVWFENLQVKYLNSALKPIARYLPGTGTIEHRGRKSGKSYKTIVTAYRKGNVLAIALAHGKTDWVKNVLAAGGCELRTRGRVVHLIEPCLFHDETRHHIRPLERQVLGVMGVADFLSLKIAPASPPRAGQ